MDKILEVLKGKYQVHKLQNHHGEILYLIDFKGILEEIYDFQIYLTRFDNEIVLTDLGSLEKALVNILTNNRPNIINGIVQDTIRTFRLQEINGMIYYEVRYMDRYVNDACSGLRWLFMSLHYAVEIAKYYIGVHKDEYQGGRNG
ncbi:MAG: hypothetical protein ABFD00_06505 [Chloroherpetonaceae bacterium]